MPIQMPGVNFSAYRLGPDHSRAGEMLGAGIAGAAKNFTNAQLEREKLEYAKSGAGGKQFAQNISTDPNTYIDPETKLLYRRKGIYDPNIGKAKSMYLGIGHENQPTGPLDIASKDYLTMEGDAEAAYKRKLAQQQAEQETVGGISKERKKGEFEGQRYGEKISLGEDAAKGIPILKRSLDLLERVGTGGVNKWGQSAKRLFGVEGADEAELSYNLGKNVLSQLKATFGPQFTEREGAKLENLEAGFGKSTQGNIRIIKQTLQIANNYVDDAIKQAVKEENYELANELKKSRDFEIDVSEYSDFLPPVNDSGWRLMKDKNGRSAYVGPNGEIEIVK